MTAAQSRMASALVLLFGAVVAILALGATPQRRVSISLPALIQRASAEDHTLLTFLLPNLGVGVIMASGRFLAGIPTVVALLKFGFDLGSFVVIGARSVPVSVLLAALLPHGVLETTGFWLCGAVGMMGVTMWRHLLVDDSHDPFPADPALSPLLAGLSCIALGAAVEHWATPQILRLTAG